MKRKIIYLTALFALCMILSSCGLVKITSVNSSDLSPQPSAIPTPEIKQDRYTVSFDKDEIFLDEIYRRAAEHIDPYIEQAVKLMNSVREDRISFKVIDYDYSKRPKARDTIKNNLSLKVYDEMVEKAYSFEDYCFDSNSFSDDLFNIAVTANDAVRLDYPYLLLYCDMKISGNKYHSSYYLPGDWINKSCSDKELIKSQVRLYDCIVERILNKMPENLTNQEKIRYFVFVISAAVSYDTEYETYGNNYQAYDALVNGKALCEGYSLAFYYLCQQSGISCWYCLGEAPYELGYHAWNMVETEEGPIYIDITWYDTEDLWENYRNGKTTYLFMSQEDYDYYGYIEKSKR